MTGVLLINLGTPDAPTPDAVGRYLRQFLMDPFVIDTPAPLRWLLVNVAIVPRRKYRSAEAYQKIQMPEGSPLLVHTRALAHEVARCLGTHASSVPPSEQAGGLRTQETYSVEFGMRYGNPSIKSALEKLKSRGVSRIIVLPLYPQYAESSFETAVVEAKRSARELGCEELLSFLPPFYNDPGFINSLADRIRANIDPEKTDHLVFSFHGLPVRHVTKFHRDNHSRPTVDCCSEISSTNQNCYRAQCFETARAIATQLQLHPDDYTVSFQSRLGRAEWIGPNTVNVLEDLAQRGIKRIAVTCPSFVSDCLETLEEMGMRGRETFLEAGGESLQLIPSLNTDAAWVEAAAKMIQAL
ncbi:MAG TPA: ferrochelatase [Pyrinomonadaceae bacterium]|nr:ferrochelatase [Pyrinomonadaceae bacterium]